MKKTIYKLLSTLLFCSASILSIGQINPVFLGRYSTGFYDKAAAEITAYHSKSKQMFVLNAADTTVKVVNISNPASPLLAFSISIKPYGIDLTSITCYNDIIAVAVIDSLGKTENGKVVFFNANTLAYINQVDVGANPDMICFSPDGNKVLVANEGEPNVGYTIDPEGSVSIINITGGVGSLTQANVQTAGFNSFNGTTLDPKIKITGKIQAGGVFSRNSTIAEDLEPEYITVSVNSSMAWVTCQENNCIAEINLNTASVTRLIPLGYKNHSLTGNGIDASNQGSTINIATNTVFGMYMPDAISNYTVGGNTYLVTANEGDVRADWGTANNEETDVRNVSYVLDTSKFLNAANVAFLKSDAGVGRLKVSNKYGDFNGDGKFDSIFCFGGRSFSIWNATTGAIVWDSKDDFEQRTAALFPAYFNTSHTNNSKKNRSDDKGPEPEAIAIGKILDSTYAFIGLERIGGIMIYNITNPNNPYFVNYINTRDFSQTPGTNSGGDLGPEGLVFVPRNQSPNGKDLLILSNEISGTVTIIQLNSRSAFQMQVLHASDMESGIDAPIDASNFAAVLDTLEGTYANTVKLASGDCYIPGPFLSAGEDPSMQTPLRNTASSYYSGTTSGLRAAIGRTDIAMMNIMGFQGSAFGNHEFDLGTPEVNSIIGVDIRSNGADKRWIGAQFPYLSANLNFSNDINLSYLTTNQRLSVDSFKTSPNITANSQKKGIAPSAIIEMNGEKVGIVGATTQVLAAISSPGATTVLSGGPDNMPALAAVLQPVIDSLRVMGINKIIVMSHLQQLSNEKALAPLLKGVDIIIAGGSHSLCADGNDRLRAGIPVSDRYPILTVNNDNEPLAILNTTAEWKYVGRFVCDFDSLGVLLTNLLDSNINGAYAADTAMVTLLYGTYAAGFTVGSKGANVRTLTSAIGNEINNKDGNKFGKSNVFLEGRRNLVRTEETNFGNLSSDANLWYARQYDNQVKVSIKNGSGIRSAIGNVNAVGNTTLLEKTLANPSAGKLSGDISQLDIENSLRFNNGLTIGRVNAAGLKRILEHGISATKPGATPGQFPQVGGVAFSYDSTKLVGSKIQSLVIIDSLGNILDTIIRNGVLHGDTSRMIKFVTLDFLYGGGDNYPFLANSNLRVNLDTAIKTTGIAAFTTTGKEQDAFAEFMANNYNTNPYNVSDTTLKGDKRIQLLNARLEGIFPPIVIPVLSAFNLVSPPNNSRLEVEQNNASFVNINWVKSANASSYKWFVTAATGSFTAPLLRVASNNAGADSVLTLTSGGIDNILNSLNIKRTDSVTLKWTVFAYLGSDSLKATQDWNVTLVRKRILGAFNLTAPANNARLEVEQNSTTPVVISWSAASNANSYKWKATTLASNFNTPLLNIVSDNSGIDTKLTLNSGAIDAILASNTIAKGDSITLKWTVFALETTDSIAASQTFNVNLVRKAGVGINNASILENIYVYPNPSNNELNIRTNNITDDLIVKLYSLTGKLLFENKLNASINNILNVSELKAGVYMLSIETTDDKSAMIKVVIMH
jgi:2',3'-cyclic-nucleotide 2'-phosphodiesterase/3'-nucleotidase/5'-nucleotidase